MPTMRHGCSAVKKPWICLPRFLKGESIDNLDGIISMTREQMEADRTPWWRGVFPVLQPESKLSHCVLWMAKCSQITVVDIAFFGVYLKRFLPAGSLIFVVDIHVSPGLADWADERQSLRVNVTIFDATACQGLRILFSTVVLRLSWPDTTCFIERSETG